jgi:hypothetical protein
MGVETEGVGQRGVGGVNGVECVVVVLVLPVARAAVAAVAEKIDRVMEENVDKSGGPPFHSRVHVSSHHVHVHVQGLEG